MSAALGTKENPAWREIAQKMDPLPTATTKGGTAQVFVLADAYDSSNGSSKYSGKPPSQCNGDECSMRSGKCGLCKEQPPGSMDVATWPIWPAGAITLASSPALLAIAQETLRTSALWSQGNSFCSVWSQAARVGLPLHEWLGELHTFIIDDQLGDQARWRGR